MAAERAVLQSERAELEGEVAALREELLRMEQDKMAAASERVTLQETLTATEQERNKVGAVGQSVLPSPMEVWSSSNLTDLEKGLLSQKI